MVELRVDLLPQLNVWLSPLGWFVEHKIDLGCNFTEAEAFSFVD
jgi:hypothetical protein